MATGLNKTGGVELEDLGGSPTLPPASSITLVKTVGATGVSIVDDLGAVVEVVDTTDISTQSQIDNGSGAGFISPTTLGGASILRTKYGGFGVAKYDNSFMSGVVSVTPIPLVRRDATTAGDTVSFPINAWIRWSGVYVVTGVVGAGTTLDIGYVGSAAAIKTGLPAAYTAGMKDGLPVLDAFSSFGAASTSVGTLNLTLTGGADVTAGKFYVFYEWINF